MEALIINIKIHGESKTNHYSIISFKCAYFEIFDRRKSVEKLSC